MTDKRLSVNLQSTRPLLNLIANAESNGNYNAYFGNSSNTSVRFTEMTIAEVQSWQADFIAKGNASSAVGRYQIINTTLDGLVREQNLDKNALFDEKQQDELAQILLKRRGIEQFVNEEISDTTFAANLAKEWAGLPKIVGENSEESYYASDGLNKSNATSKEVLNAVRRITPKT